VLNAPTLGFDAGTETVARKHWLFAIPSKSTCFGLLGNQTPGPPAAGPVNYTMDAVAFVPGSGSMLDCSPSDLATSKTSTSGTLTVTAGSSVAAATLAFTRCQ